MVSHARQLTARVIAFSAQRHEFNKSVINLRMCSRLNILYYIFTHIHLYIHIDSALLKYGVALNASPMLNFMEFSISIILFAFENY